MTITEIFSSGSDVIIVTHGSEYGMYMPLVPGNKNRANTANLNTLMTAAVSEIEKNFDLKADPVEDLMARADAVRKIKLGHIAFRGCSIGAQKKNLEVLRDFLGANWYSISRKPPAMGTNSCAIFGPNKVYYSDDPAYRNHQLVYHYAGTAHLYPYDRGMVKSTQ